MDKLINTNMEGTEVSKRKWTQKCGQRLLPPLGWEGVRWWQWACEQFFLPFRASMGGLHSGYSVSTYFDRECQFKGIEQSFSTGGNWAH
jgi:hypothetical protein